MLGVLSSDVVCHIFSYLSAADLLSVENTCQFFRNATPCEENWRVAYYHAYPQSALKLLTGIAPTWREVYRYKLSLLSAWRQCNLTKLLSLPAHSDGVNSIAVQKSRLDTNLFATCSFDHLVKVWRKPTPEATIQEPLMSMSGHQHAVWTLAWAPSSNELYSASIDNTVRCWDVTTGQSLNVLEVDSDRLLSLAPDQTTIWTGSLRGELLQWDTNSPATITHRIQCLTPCVSSLYKAEHLLYIGGVKDIEIWDDRFLVDPMSQLLGHQQSVMDITMLDADNIASVSKDCTLKIWDAQAIESIPRFDMVAHTTAVRSVAVCDSTVATSSNDSSVSLWRHCGDAKLDKLTTLHLHTKQVPQVDLDELSLYTASCDNTITIHNVV